MLRILACFSLFLTVSPCVPTGIMRGSFGMMSSPTFVVELSWFFLPSKESEGCASCVAGFLLPDGVVNVSFRMYIA